MRALISWAVYRFPSTSSVVHDVPMWRLTERIVRSGLVIAWRLATSPTNTSPFLAKATTDGVVRPPSALGMTVGSPPSRTLTTELVVPRSIPTALGIPNPPTNETCGAHECNHPYRDSTTELESLIVKNSVVAHSAMATAGWGRE